MSVVVRSVSVGAHAMTGLGLGRVIARWRGSERSDVLRRGYAVGSDRGDERLEADDGHDARLIVGEN